MYDQGDQFPNMEAPMPEQINLDTLPDGSVVTDRDGDDWVKVDGYWRFIFTLDPLDLSEHQRTSEYLYPYMPFTMGQPAPPDTYQQARVALRDRYGIEPQIDDVHAVQRIMEYHDITAAAAVSALQLAHASEIPDPDATDRDDEQARAFIKSYQRMDRMLSQARDTIRNRDQRITEIQRKAERELELAAAAHEQDERIRWWQAVSNHPYFRELSDDSAADERPWVDIILERLTQLAERPKTSGTVPTAYTFMPMGDAIRVTIESKGVGSTSITVEAADTTAGLARLRAHSALDGLLDQHGISR